MNDSQIKTFVARQLASIDPAEPEPGWRRRLGASKRPKLPRHALMTFTVSLEEAQLLREQAKAAGIPLRQHLRRLCGLR